MVFLPDDAKKPMILRYDPSLDPIIRLGLTGGPDLFYTRYVAEELIKRELETVEGVAAVRVKGGLEEEIWVELNEQKISLLGLDIQQIRQRLAQENVNLAGGNLKEGQTEYIVRTLNEFRSVEEIGNILLRFNNERELRLRDIANVYRTNKERQIITRLNGQESVEMEIFKEGDANIVEVARRVREKVFGSPEQQAFVAEMKQKQSVSAESSPGNPQEDFRRKMLQQQMTDFIDYNLPADLDIALLTDQSVFISNSINEVKNTAVLGGILAVIVLFFFLNNVRTTVIVGLAIPISIIATFAPMSLFDVSLNIMSLGGLALGIGMLVDNSIVVTESIFRCREEGDTMLEAVVRGTGEVGSAVVASTLTTIAVFFPMVFVKGVAGQIFGDLALTVVFSLLASLGVALFFIPMLASRQLDLQRKTGESNSGSLAFFRHFESITQFRRNWRNYRAGMRSRSGAGKMLRLILLPLFLVFQILRFIIFFILNILSKLLTLVLLVIGIIIKAVAWFFDKIIMAGMRYPLHYFDRGMKQVNTGYSRVLDKALENKAAVIISAGLTFVLVVFIILPNVGQELIPEVHQGEFNLELTLPVGTPVEKTVEIIEPIEEYLQEQPEVEKTATVAGVDLTQISDSEAGEHTAKITVELDPALNAASAEERVIDQIRGRISSFGGISYKVTRPVLFSFKTPLEVEIKGYSLEKLTEASREAVGRISQIPGVFDVKSNIQSGNPEVQIVYDRARLAFYGLNVLEVANIVRNKVRGDVATQFKEEDRRIDVRVKVRDKDKATLDRLRRINVNPGGAISIPLESVADIQVEEGPSEIRRINQQRSAVIMANIKGRDLMSISGDVYRALSGMDLPENFNFEITGQNREMEVSLNSLRLALLLAIFMVYIVMASQFESFLHPFVILFTVPLALIGVALALYIFAIPLNIMVFLGMIMLAGIVVNNAIVLVDYINQLRRRGLPKLEAIRQAGQARLRPILMTSLTTILGLLPMAIGLGEGAEIRTPMAITVIAGLISATLL
ncbi:MAG: efflux RND transporter permease subunit, partial [Calditrichia bacterium]